MQSFSYHQKAGPLRSEVFSLSMVAGSELVVWAIVIPLVPVPWRWLLLALVLLLTAVVLRLALVPLRRRHQVKDGCLYLTYGHPTFRLTVPLVQIRRASRAEQPLPRGGVGPWRRVAYRAETDEICLLSDRTRLVRLELAKPMECRLPAITQFSRILLTLDEPEAFVKALAAAGVPTGSAPHQAHASAQLPAVVAPGGAVGGEPLASLEGLTRRFGSFTAVDGISLTVRPGEVLALLGSNGAGKSTTIRMMTGLLRPTAGRVLLGGDDLWAPGGRARRLLGYVPDVPLLYDGLTARESLWLMAGLYGLSKSEGRRRADELLAFMGLERWADQLIRTFSLGMKRKMAIAGALVHRPRLLLLDEVTNGLDPRAARDVKDLIAAQAKAGVGMILTTHILDVVEELAHRIALIHRGRLAAVGDLPELRRAAGLPGANLEQLFLALTTDRRLEVGV